jgi:hypothetical protein
VAGGPADDALRGRPCRCQLKGANGNITLLWTKGPEVSVDVTGLGSTVQYLDGTSLPIGSSKTIGLGIAPVAVS